MTAMAQRDYKLVESRNAWLASGNAAALTTMANSTIAAGKVFFLHDNGELGAAAVGRRSNAYGADMRSYCRLSEEVVAYGSVTYSNVHGTEMAGSMLFPTTELMPFDIREVSDDNAGSKQSETFNIVGAIGWDTGRDVSVGAKVDFTAGSYAKYRDLRHTNTLMNLCTDVTVMYRPWGIGGGLLYRRTTETLNFKTYGTTDRVYQSLVDYANGCGETETFGGEGFTDGSQEQPLFSEYMGVTGQWKCGRMFIDVAWRHRNGYYGRQSQYTASHSSHNGDSFDARLRCNLAESGRRLWWIDMTLCTEKLTAKRTNYRKVASAENASLLYYEYYEPTKMSDKVQTAAEMAVTGYWKAAGEIYLWHLNGGLGWWNDRQTAYRYPDGNTARRHTVSPFVTMRRGILFRDTSLLTVQAGCAMTLGSMETVDTKARIAYEMPLNGTAVRPCLSLNYSYSTATGGNISGQSRHVLAVTAEVTF